MLVSYLKRTQNQVKNKPQLSLHLLWNECKHYKIDPKQGNQKQCWFCQSPETTKQKADLYLEWNQFSICLNIQYANNEMQLQSTCHFAFQLRESEMEKTPLKVSAGKQLMHYGWLMRCSPSQKRIT